MNTEPFKHELTTEVPSAFPGRLIGAIQTAAGGDRVRIDQEGNVVRIAVKDDHAARWLVKWLDGRETDAARQLADAVESAFLAADGNTQEVEAIGSEAPGTTEN